MSTILLPFFASYILLWLGLGIGIADTRYKNQFVKGFIAIVFAPFILGYLLGEKIGYKRLSDDS